MTTALQAYRRSPSPEQQAAAKDLVRSMQEAFNAKDADGSAAIWPRMRSGPTGAACVPSAAGASSSSDAR